MCFETIDATQVKSKDEVFDIMGKYYGNEHYRAAIRLGWTKKELFVLKGLLDEINDLGYYFSNLHKLSYIADLRFVPILLEYYDIIDNKDAILDALHHKEYFKYTPAVLELYNNTTSSELRFGISSALFAMRSRKYIDYYLETVNRPDYIGNDMISVILCKYHVKEFSNRFIDLYNMNPKAVSWNMAHYGYLLGDRKMLPILEALEKSTTKEISHSAKKSLEKLLLS